MKVCPRCAELYPDDAVRCARDAADLKAVLDPLIGKTIGGRYRLISRVGSGGMSSVYLARHVLIDRLMAIKILRRDLAQDSVQRDRFLREARAVNRINHENIVEITDFGETDDGIVYLVMEYVPGESLLKTLSQCPFSAARALDITEQITSALARAHQMGVVHRDLKPENILLVRRKGRADFVKVLDFGIAKIMDAPSLTGSQQIFGTPGYIAPEYIQSTQIDGRSDIYSLGVMLYEMVTGALPFDYEYPGDLLVKHVTEEPIPPSTRNPDVAPAVEQLVLRCLRKNPADRFRDAFHLLAEIQRVRERLGPPASWGAMGESKLPPKRDRNDERATIETLPPPPEDETVPEPGSVSNPAIAAPPAARPPVAAAADASAGYPDEGEPPGRPTLVDPPPADFAKTMPRMPTVNPARVSASAPSASASSASSPTSGRVRMPTREYPRPSIPEPPLVAGIGLPIEIDVDVDSDLEPGSPGSAPPPPPKPDQGLLGVAQWRRRFDAIRSVLDEIGVDATVPPEIESSMARASEVLEQLEDGALRAESQQRRAEELSERARHLRATLGQQIDEVARKLSKHRGEFERLVSRTHELRERRDAARVHLRDRVGTEGEADALLWELAAVELELRAEGTRCDDLEVAASGLRVQLDRQSELCEKELTALGQSLDAQMIDLEPRALSLRDPLEGAEAYVRRFTDEHRQAPPSA